MNPGSLQWGKAQAGSCTGRASRTLLLLLVSCTAGACQEPRPSAESTLSPAAPGTVNTLHGAAPSSEGAAPAAVLPLPPSEPQNPFAGLPADTGRPAPSALELPRLTLRVDSLAPCREEQTLPPPPSQERMVARVRLLARRNPLPLHPLAFSLTQGSNVHRATLATCGGQAAPRGELPAGQEAELHLTFDLPVGQSPERLCFEPLLPGEPPLRACVALPR